MSYQARIPINGSNDFGFVDYHLVARREQNALNAPVETENRRGKIFDAHIINPKVRALNEREIFYLAASRLAEVESFRAEFKGKFIRPPAQAAEKFNHILRAVVHVLHKPFDNLFTPLAENRNIRLDNIALFVFRVNVNAHVQENRQALCQMINFCAQCLSCKAGFSQKIIRVVLRKRGY